MQKFKHIMKELQGAIIIASAFQAILGYSGLMSILLRYVPASLYPSTLKFVIRECFPFHLASKNW